MPIRSALVLTVSARSFCLRKYAVEPYAETQTKKMYVVSGFSRTVIRSA